MRLPVPLRTALAMACAGALASAPLMAPVSASASAERSVAPRAAAMPHITAKIKKNKITLKGTSGLRAGRVGLEVKGQGTVEFAMFDKGYEPTDFAADVDKFNAKGDTKALKRAIANTTILGGLGGGDTGTIVLPKAGSYTAFSIGRKTVLGPTFRASGPARKASAPRVDGKLIAKKGLSWGGASQLPAKGRLMFKNKRDAGQPHFVALQQVTEGTTVDQLLEALQQSGPNSPPPPFLLEGAFDTGTLSPGHDMTADYDLPPGQYALMCFFPDPSMKGMPHALMGMVRMIHLT